MANQELIAESCREVFQWVVAGTVIAMVIPVARETDEWFTVGLVLLLAFVIAAPVNYLLKLGEHQFHEDKE